MFYCKRCEGIAKARRLLDDFAAELQAKNHLAPATVHNMMGHKISNYFDIKMRGIEYLRGIYLSSGMSIRPQSEENKINALKQIIRSWRLNPEKILTREALG